VLDDNDVYCPARVLSINRQKLGDVKSIYISYIGWEDIWNETIHSKDEIIRRVNIGKLTLRQCRAWIKVGENLPQWPGKVYIRSTLPGSSKGKEYLQSENRLYIELYGPKIRKLAAYHSGFWRNSNCIIPFIGRKDTRYGFVFLMRDFM
jgi:hypothetical protein